MTHEFAIIAYTVKNENGANDITGTLAGNYMISIAAGAPYIYQP